MHILALDIPQPPDWFVKIPELLKVRHANTTRHKKYSLPYFCVKIQIIRPLFYSNYTPIYIWKWSQIFISNIQNLIDSYIAYDRPKKSKQKLLFMAKADRLSCSNPLSVYVTDASSLSSWDADVTDKKSTNKKTLLNIKCYLLSLYNSMLIPQGRNNSFQI